MSKGLEWIEVLVDTDKFHNMLLLEKAGGGQRGKQGNNLSSPVAGFH